MLYQARMLANAAFGLVLIVAVINGEIHKVVARPPLPGIVLALEAPRAA